MGVPINMGINRRLEYRLWFLIIDNEIKCINKKIENLKSYTKCDREEGEQMVNHILEIPRL